MPPEAPAPKAFLAFALDYLAFGLLIFMTVWDLVGGWVLLLGPLATILYRTLARSGGRQTFGQAVFHIMTLSESAGPATFKTALERSLLEFWFVPLALFRRTASAKLEQKTSTLEVTLV